MFEDKALEKQFTLMTRPYQDMTIRGINVLLTELEALERFWRSTVIDVREAEGIEAAERAKDIRLTPVQQRLKEVKDFRNQKEREWRGHMWERYNRSTSDSDIIRKAIGAWETRQSIRQREELRDRYVFFYHLTQEQRVEYFRDFMLISELDRFSRWMYSSFLMDTTKYIGHKDLNNARIILYMITTLYIVLTAAYILLFGIDNGAVKTNKAIAA